MKKTGILMVEHGKLLLVWAADMMDLLEKSIYQFYSNLTNLLHESS